MFFSRSILIFWKLPTEIFSKYLMMQMITLETGTITSLCGLLMLRKYSKSQETISINGKVYLTKLEIIEKHLIIVKLKNYLVLLLLTIDWFSIKSLLNMTHGISKFLVILVRNSVILLKLSLTIFKMLKASQKKSTLVTFLLILLKWSMNSKLSRKNILSGQKMLKNSIVQIVYLKDKDTNIHLIGQNLIKS